MKVNELREQTIEELEKRLSEVKKTIFNLKFQKATGQLENPMRIKNLKKEVAAINTLIREKELGINKKSGK
ncbi:MAG: 50S ribosomal protein L29 [Actinomycetota bacterium]|jgi:large subunit ribosomal protein L29|nr:50S ribosomal protein L29 [Actinomycetota bacterium]